MLLGRACAISLLDAATLGVTLPGSGGEPMKLGVLCSKAGEPWWREAAAQADASVKLRVHHTDRGGISASAQAVAEAVGDCKMLWLPTTAFDAAVLPRKPALYAPAVATFPTAAGSAPCLPLRLKPEIHHLKEVAGADKLGQIGMIRLSLCRSATAAGRFAYEEFAPETPALDTLGPHAFDALRWCFGEIDRVHAVQSQATTGYSLCVARMASGAIAHIECSLVEAPGGDYLAYEIAGAHGILEYDSRKEPLLELVTNRGEREPAVPPAELVAALRSFLQGAPDELATTADATAAAAVVRQAADSIAAMNG
jgi:hypothetical protein